MDDFALFKMKPHFYQETGLPEIDFPIPVNDLEYFIESGNIDYSLLLYWLQEYSSQHPDKWIDLEAAMYRLAEMLAPKDDRESVPVEGDTWYFLLSPVDLTKEIVTIQRQDRLIAAIQSLPNGQLKVSAYRSLDAKSCRYLIGLGLNPHPDHGVCMRENNWEYALDSSAATGNMYASERGEAYLSYWQFGIGINYNHEEIPEWIDMQRLKPLPVNIAAIQVGACYVNNEDDL